MPSDPSKRFQLIMDEKLMKRVKSWASKHKVNVSEAIRRLVEMGLEKK